MTIAVLWALAAVFALDWQFQRNIDLWQRLFLLALAAAAVIWAFVRFARPWLGKREDMTDMALLVQRHAGIDSDLVAALQFESTDAANWGSTQLETAVIDRVAAVQKKLDVMAAMPRQPLARRWKVLVATVAVWALLGVFAPNHVWTFFQRLALSSQHYPSQTVLKAVTINDKIVDLSTPGAVVVHVPCGQAVRFEVAVEGAQPDSGRVEVFTQARGAAAIVPLDPLPAEAHYGGKYAALGEAARCQIYAGDAWTDPISLSVTPLPVVEIEAEVVPPVYARQSAQEVQKLHRGNREFTVLAGSEVRLKLDSDRPLKSAEVTIARQTYSMRRDDPPADGREVWTLANAGTPLASVAEETSFAIQVRDREDQTPEQPLKGTIGIESDMPPTITATARTLIVVSDKDFSGSPNIHYEAADDHALGRIWLTWEATSDDASGAAEKREGEIEVSRFPPEALPRSCNGDYPLVLKSLPLKPGDTLKVTFHVSDYRGPAAAATADADPPLIFQVTDLRGFEASMYDADQKSAGVLEDIRKKHSGLGETQ